MSLLIKQVFNALMPWLAPEVSAGLQNAHCRQYSLMSDVWSFGVLVWECLSAEKPFTGWHPHEVSTSLFLISYLFSLKK